MVNTTSLFILLNALSFAVIICCFILHLHNHFEFKSSLCVRKTYVGSNKTRCKSHSNAVSPSSQPHQHLLCCLYAQSGDIEFYPLSTLLYFYCLILIILVVIIVSILDKKHYYIHPQYINTYCPLQTNIMQLINNPLSTTSLSINHKYDFIWSYTVLLLLLWETLFNFFRFYDACFMSKYLRNPSNKTIFSFYSIYFIIFSTLYLIQIHLYFATFILLIIMHFTFNIYCINGFITILNDQYKYSFTVSASHSVGQEYLQIINKVKKCSIIILLISTSFLLLISACYTNYFTIMLLPVFWMISCIVCTLNFAKNGLWLISKYEIFAAYISFFCLYQPDKNIEKAVAESAQQEIDTVQENPDVKSKSSFSDKASQPDQSTHVTVGSNIKIKININDIDINDIQLNQSSELQLELQDVPSIPSHISISSQPINNNSSNDNINNINLLNVASEKTEIDNSETSKHNIVYSNSLTPISGANSSPRHSMFVNAPNMKITISHKRSFSDGELKIKQNTKHKASSILFDMMVNQGFYPQIK